MPKPETYKKEYSSKSFLEDFLARCNRDQHLPTIEQLAIYIGVITKTVYNWSESHPEFRKQMDRIKEIQKQQLLDRGLNNSYNAAITKLILSHNHQMRETTETVHTGNDKAPLRIMYKND